MLVYNPRLGLDGEELNSRKILESSRIEEIRYGIIVLELRSSMYKR